MRYQTKSNYLETYKANKSCFGGDLLRGNAKTARPISPHQALHIVMRSSLARGKLSMLVPSKRVQILAILRRQSKKFGVKIYHFANSGNHLHILVKPSQKRSNFAHFMRAISGIIARLILKAERGNPKGKRFWDKRPFTRVIQWGRAFSACFRYIGKNTLEAVGLEELMDIEKEIRAWHFFDRSAAPPH